MTSLSRGPDEVPVAEDMAGRCWVADAGILRTPPFLAMSLGISLVILACEFRTKLCAQKKNTKTHNHKQKDMVVCSDGITPG